MAAQPKGRLRTRFKALRQDHSAGLQCSLDRRGRPDLTALLDRRPRPAHAATVGLAYPLSGEPDLRPWLAATGVPLALPAVEAGRLVYRSWQPGQELVPDACGIPAPSASGPALPAADLALLLVPALAVDRVGVRLGYGGGWYDRLRADRHWRRVPALAVLPAACVCDRLPADPWDVPFDGWLDEQGVHWLR